jgi:hypothetical protein
LFYAQKWKNGMEKVKDVSDSRRRLSVSSDPSSADGFNVEGCICVMNYTTNLVDVGCTPSFVLSLL